jgi:hypothetical protein
MFYKALGFAVWKLGTAYLRRRFGRQLKIGGGLALASIVAAGYYLATRSATED